MAPQWFMGEKPARPGGRDGVIAILADTSGSMDINVLTVALRSVARAVPRARVFVFADTVLEVPRLRDGGGLPDVGGGTTMEVGLEAVARLYPQQTIVLSDGYVNTGTCLAVADGMTGAISSLWFPTPGIADHSDNSGRAFMQELARRGGGQFRDYDPAKGANGLAQELISIVRIVEVHHHRGETRHVHHDREHHAMQRAPSRVRIIRR